MLSLNFSKGFLGCHLLHELLSKLSAKVICIVRGNSSRVKEALQHFELEVPDFNTRVEILQGDISKPRFALSEAIFESLTKSVDSIVHCAAEVKFNQNYSTLKAANVESVVEVNIIYIRRFNV
jgi:myxalamid-type nonribosomal peptide synthetase MxaA